jgi:hypothetical protein
MAGLPWVRLDSNISTHDKILYLVSDPSTLRWQAAFSYVCALAWSGGQGTDGKIPSAALGIVHGTQKTARLLVKYRLWTEATAGFQIVNFSQRQQSNDATTAIKAAQSTGGKLGNCKRHHGDLCWKNGKCSREEAS